MVVLLLQSFEKLNSHIEKDKSIKRDIHCVYKSDFIRMS